MWFDITEDYITIYEGKGYEVVHWNREEWEGDRFVCEAIAEAIYLSQTDPDTLDYMLSK